MSTAALEAPPVAPSTTPTEPQAAAPAAESGNFGDSLDAFFAGQDLDLVNPPAAPAAAAAEPTKPAAAAEPAKPAAADAPPADPDPLDEIGEGLKDWTPQAARRFKEVKTEAKQFKARAVELEAQLQQREARLQELEALANDPKVKDITNRAEEYEQAMILRNLESSNAYKQLVAEPLAKMVNEIDAVAAQYNVDGDALIDIVVMEDRATQLERLGEILSGANDFDKYRVFKIIDEVKPVLEQRRVLQENAQEALREVEEMERQREQTTLAERAQTRLTAAKAVAKRIEDTMPFLKAFDGVDLPGLTDEAAKTDFTSLDPARGTYNAMAGKLLPKLANQYLSARREIEKLTEQLAEYDNAGSPLNGGSAAGGAGLSSDPRSFVEAVESAFGGR